MIISTAIPKITDEFNSIDDIGWYSSAYVLTACVTQLLFGKMYQFYNNKVVYLAGLVLFEAGSAVCGSAPNSLALILGRAIAGCGAAGIFCGVIVLMIPVIPLDKRPLFQGLMGSVFGISSVIGPLIGGAFTTNRHLTWRWCFYINLPIGALPILMTLVVLRARRPANANLSIGEKVKRFDPVGNVLFIPAIICLLLGLEWGGSRYDWSNARIIVLFVLSGVLMAGFLVVQMFSDEECVTLPPRILKQRSILAGWGLAHCVGSVMFVSDSYLPIWFQAIKGTDALESGIRTIPLVLSLVVASILAGIATNRIGYYIPAILTSAILMPIGAGLYTTLRPDSGHAAWIGYQVILGLGLGAGMQQPNMAVQTVLANSRADAAMGVALMSFSQQLAGAIWSCVAQTVFLQRLVHELGESGLMSRAAATTVAKTGATNLRQFLSTDKLGEALHRYNGALVDVFWVSLALSCAAVVPAVTFEWRSVKKRG